MRVHLVLLGFCFLFFSGCDTKLNPPASRPIGPNFDFEEQGDSDNPIGLEIPDHLFTFTALDQSGIDLQVESIRIPDPYGDNEGVSAFLVEASSEDQFGEFFFEAHPIGDPTNLRIEYFWELRLSKNSPYIQLNHRLTPIAHFFVHEFRERQNPYELKCTMIMRSHGENGSLSITRTFRTFIVFGLSY